MAEPSGGLQVSNPVHPQQSPTGAHLTTDKAIRIMAGLFILLSLGLGVEGSPIFVARGWLWFTAFVGANLFQSAITGFCPAEMIFRRLGMKRAGEA